jgi:hypothetical protein
VKHRLTRTICLVKGRLCIEQIDMQQNEERKRKWKLTGAADAEAAGTGTGRNAAFVGAFGTKIEKQSIKSTIRNYDYPTKEQYIFL